MTVTPRKIGIERNFLNLRISTKISTFHITLDERMNQEERKHVYSQRSYLS